MHAWDGPYQSNHELIASAALFSQLLVRFCGYALHLPTNEHEQIRDFEGWTNCLWIDQSDGGTEHDFCLRWPWRLGTIIWSNMVGQRCRGVYEDAWYRKPHADWGENWGRCYYSSSCLGKKLPKSERLTLLKQVCMPAPNWLRAIFSSQKPSNICPENKNFIQKTKHEIRSCYSGRYERHRQEDIIEFM